MVNIYNVPGAILKAKNLTHINSFIPTDDLSNIIFHHLRDEKTERQSGCHLAKEELGFQPRESYSRVYTLNKIPY